MHPSSPGDVLFILVKTCAFQKFRGSWERDESSTTVTTPVIVHLSLSLSLSLNLKGKLCRASAFKRNGDSVCAVTRAAVSLFLPSTHRFTPTQTVVACLFAVARDSQFSFDYVYSCTRSRQRKHTAHLHTCCWLAGCRFLFPFFFI